MTSVLYVDPIGGAAGDMLLAALLDAGAPEDVVRSAVEAVVPGRFALSTEEVIRGGLRARMLRRVPAGRPEDAAGAVGPTDAVPRRFAELLAAVDGAFIHERVRTAAGAVLKRLGRAEARVHGIPPEELTLHELGDDDTLLDVVGIAAALDALHIDRILVGPVPLGAGGMAPGRHLHGPVPLPATVTLELLTGFPLRGAGPDETVTPTAAAVFAALAEPAEALPDMTLQAVGYGAGTRDPMDRPNVVRVLVGTAGPGEGADRPGRSRTRPLTVLEANLDDMTPELVADATEALRGVGALDVWTAPVQMKKGRPGFVLSALCEPAEEAAVRAEFFRTTSTFGIRSYLVLRTELERRTVAVPVSGGTVRVKLGLLGGGVLDAAPEHDDVTHLAAQLGRPIREVYEEALTAAHRLREEETAATRLHIRDEEISAAARRLWGPEDPA